MPADHDNPPPPEARFTATALRNADGKTTPEQRSRAGTALNNHRWSKTTDRAAATQAARDARMEGYRDRVDPDRKLPADVREQRARQAMSADLAARRMMRGRKGGQR